MQSFAPALILKNGHIQTIYPFIFRKKKTISYSQRIRINTPDNDFLDIDFVTKFTTLFNNTEIMLNIFDNIYNIIKRYLFI